MFRALVICALLALGPAAGLASAGEIHDAAGEGDLARVRELAVTPALIDAPDDGGSTPLDLAAQGGHLDVARWLIERGASVRHADYGGAAPLHYAALGGNLELVELVVDAGCALDAEDAYGNTAIIYAAYGGHPDIVKLLHARGADLHHVNGSGQIALHFAARNGLLDLVEYTVNQGAEINRKDAYGRQAYFFAHANGQDEVADYLRAQGARDDYRIGEPKLERLAPDFTAITIPHGNRTNVGALTGPEGVLLVDTGMSAVAPVLAEAVAGLGSGPVRVIVNTHLHGDHTGANAGVDSTARVVSFDNLDALVEEGVLIRSAAGMGGSSERGFDPPYVMRFNGREVQIIPATGTHSASDVIVYVPGASVACMGSLVISEGFPGIGAGSIDRYLEILDTALEVFPPETMFVPGHGRLLDREGLVEYRAMVAATVKAVRDRMAAGASMDRACAADVLAPWSRFEQCPFLPYTTAKIWAEAIYRTYDKTD